MPGRYLLDTTAAIALLRGDQELVRLLADDCEYFVCVTVLGELFYGAEKSQRTEENAQRVEELSETCPTAVVDLEVSHLFGRTKNELRKKGRLIPEADLWIAATALRHRLTVLTRDRHFEEVDDLAVSSW